MVTRLLTLAGALVLFAVAPAQAATFNVTKTADTNDTLCNADCSLREAIQEANKPPIRADVLNVPAA